MCHGTKLSEWKRLIWQKKANIVILFSALVNISDKCLLPQKRFIKFTSLVPPPITYKPESHIPYSACCKGCKRLLWLLHCGWIPGWNQDCTLIQFPAEIFKVEGIAVQPYTALRYLTGFLWHSVVSYSILLRYFKSIAQQGPLIKCKWAL